MNNPRINTEQWRLYLVVSAGSVFGYLSAFLMPVLAGPFIDAFKFNEQELGIIFSLELSGVAVAAILTALRTHTANLRTLGIAGAFIACLGHFLSLVTDSVGLFGLTRLLAGIGEGTVLAVTFAAAARATVPERAFAISQITVTIIAMVSFIMVPRLSIFWEYRAGIAVLLVSLLIFAPAMLVLPVRDADTPPPDGTETKSSNFPYIVVGSLVLLAYALTNIADMGIWAFSERTGTSLQISAHRIGEILAMATFFSLAGSFTAATIGIRFGRIAPMAAGLTACFFVVLGVGAPANVLIYTISVVLLPFAFLFSFPYFLGALAALDERGTWAALGGSASAVGIALGPLIAGYLVEKFSYSIMTWLMCLTVVLSAILVLVAYSRPSAWHPSDAVELKAKA